MRKLKKPKPFALTLPAGPPGRWVLIVDNWQPTPKNVLITGRGHWAVGYTRKKKDAMTLYAACLAAGVTRAAGRRRVTITIVLGPGMRGCDPDSQTLSTNDGLVKCGALVDDRDRWLELMPVEYDRITRVKGTRIVLEDVK